MRKILFILLFLVPLTGLQAQSLWEIRVAPFSMGSANDYAPAFFEGGILFTSDRLGDVFKDYRMTSGGRTSNIYFVERKDSVHYGRPVKLKGINSFVNDGPMSYDFKDHTLYFTRNQLLDKKNRKQANPTGIYLVKYRNGQWGQVQPFVYNDPTYNTGHPAVSADGRMLFFASDKPGGSGMSDLYVCYRVGGKWSQPENMGSRVNSAGRDLFPYYHPSGRLFFASDRPGTLGKLDIYFTAFVDGEWIEPVHLDVPFNSPADDYAYIIDTTMHAGLFSSSRRGNDNIFLFTSLLPEMKGCRPVEEPVNCFLFYETQSKGSDTIPILYKWDFGDGQIGYGHEVEHCYDAPGKYIARLSVVDKITKQARESVASYMVEVVEQQDPTITAPDSCVIGDTITLSGAETNIPGFQPQEYYWDLGNGNLDQGVEIKTVYHTPGIYMVRLLVRGLTTTGNTVDKCVYLEITVYKGD